MRELIDATGNVKTFTYQARIKDIDSILAAFLQDYADIYGRIERKLYADYARGKDISKEKNEYLLRHGITARQFNALRIGLQGKLDSIRALQGDYIQDVKVRIKKVSVDIKKLQTKDHLTLKQANKLHQKNRLLVNLNIKLRRLEQDKKNNKVRICFGSKKLFRQQFNLQANNLKNHAQWLAKWQAARCSQFFVIGSKDETMGNQSCIATINDDQSFTLRVRVPTALIPKYGKYITINNLTYAHGQHEIAAAIANNMRRNIYARKAQNAITPGLYKQFGQAINYRFLKDDKGWRVFITCDKHAKKLISNYSLGTIISSIKAKAFKHAIAVYQVNPAYTSVIGRVKFARMYKISIHQAEAMVIARRILGFSEQLPHRWNNIPDDTGGRVTLPELVKIPRRHVWHTWAKVRKNLQAVLAAQFQRPKQETELLALAGQLAF